MEQDKWSFEKMPNQSGRTALVTGANSGLGFQEALMLAAKGATVILAGRNRRKIDGAIKQIQQQVPGAKLRCQIIDLADLDTVKQAATQIRQEEDRLDLLINNAGVMVPPFSRTKQGFEMQFGTNYLGHFALTAQLLPLLIKTSKSRIATMTSLASGLGRINFDDPNYNRRHYQRMLAYGQSKLANIMFVEELSKKLAAASVGTIATVAHPGGSNTNLMNNGGFVLRKIITPLGSQAVEKGALPILRAATDPEVRNGSFWGPDGTFGLKGNPIEIEKSAKARNADNCRRLWNLSERLTGVSFEDALGL